jgi:cytochrome P450
MVDFSQAAFLSSHSPIYLIAFDYFVKKTPNKFWKKYSSLRLEVFSLLKSKIMDYDTIYTQTKIVKSRFFQTIYDWNESNKDSNLEFTHSEILGSILTFFFAGIETSAITIQNLMHVLSKNPDEIKKFKEILKNIDVYDFSQVNDCAYLEALIAEGMRLRPTVNMIGKQAI